MVSRALTKSLIFAEELKLIAEEMKLISEDPKLILMTKDIYTHYITLRDIPSHWWVQQKISPTFEQEGKLLDSLIH